MAGESKSGKGNKKHNRNRRPVEQAMSLYVRGKISFEKYYHIKYGTNFKI